MKTMKLKLSTAIIVLFGLGAQAYEGRVTIRAVDENGNPVANAKATVQFVLGVPGGGLGNEKISNVEGLTDTNGICVLTGNGDEGTVGAAVLKEGYYGSGGHGVEFTNVDLISHRWLPWNPTITAILQKKGIQVPMYARRVDEIKIPVKDKPVGFDLEIGDWVAPYGKGETSDFVFEVNVAPPQWRTNWLGTSRRLYVIRDNKMTLNFSDDGDGIQTVAAMPYGLRLPRRAPLDGYEPQLTKREYSSNGRTPAHSDYDRNANYFFRVRTKKDAQGNIVSALYGKIYGEFNNVASGDKISFTYYLNPEPNSRNMEFNPKQNLFKNLKPLERVTAP